MQVFETMPKVWGNSYGITIPKEIVKKERISPKKKMRIIVLSNDMQELKNAFGTLRLRKSTQQVMDEIDEGYDS